MFKTAILKVISTAKSKLKRLLRRGDIEPFTGTRIRSGAALRRIGSDYGGWHVPADVLTQHSICYCVGVGEDITFDVGLIEELRCKVFAYDPTPRAILHAQQCAGSIEDYHFFPIGVWDQDEVMKFYAPSNPEHVSHSILNIQKTSEYFEARCMRLRELMRENGHSRIDLLKLDIEGAEYRVINSILEDGLDIRVICVEFDELHHPLEGDYVGRIREAIQKLMAAGYKIISVEGSNYTFQRR